MFIPAPAFLAIGALALFGSTAAIAADPASLSDARGAAPFTVTARAVVRAGESVDIAAALSTRLLSAPFKPGQYVERGQTLATFDCARMRADLKARDQAARTLALRYQSEAELAAFGATGALDVEVAKSEADQAVAEADALRVTLADCEITAPFNAHISARHLPAFATPQPGQPIYTLIRAGDVEVSVIVPASFGATLSPGTRFSLRMDGSDAELRARITRLAPDIDPVSQTREVFASAPSKTLKPGMSGRAVFAAKP